MRESCEKQVLIRILLRSFCQMDLKKPILKTFSNIVRLGNNIYYVHLAFMRGDQKAMPAGLSRLLCINNAHAISANCDRRTDIHVMQAAGSRPTIWHEHSTLDSRNPITDPFSTYIFYYIYFALRSTSSLIINYFP